MIDLSRDTFGDPLAELVLTPPTPKMMNLNFCGRVDFLLWNRMQDGRRRENATCLDRILFYRREEGRVIKRKGGDENMDLDDPKM